VPQLKNRPLDSFVDAFLDAVADDNLRVDRRTLVTLRQAATGAPPQVWRPSVVGFGSCLHVYASGQEGDWMLAGFAPRKRNLSLYLTCDIRQVPHLPDKRGPHSGGQGCLYHKRLCDIHLPTLKRLVKAAVQQLRNVKKAQPKKAKPAVKRPRKG
jgi:hypothetical protein